MPSATRQTKQFAYAVATVILTLGLLEGFARALELLVPPLPVDATLGFDAETRVFVRRDRGSDELVTNPAKLAYFQDQKFTVRKPQGTYRIVAMGGSSIYRLQEELGNLRSHVAEALKGAYERVEVINAGGNSYGSHRLVLIARELADYGPDLALIYSGHNEFEEIEQLELARPSLRLLPILRVAERFALFRVGRDIANRLDRRRLARYRRQHSLASSAPDSGAAWAYPFTMEDVGRRMDQYQQNLTTIIETFRQRHVSVILGTVPSNLVAPHLPASAVGRYQRVDELFRAQRYAEGAGLAREILRTTPGRHQSSDLENGIIRALAAREPVTLADVENAVIEHEPHGVPGYALFEDHCHLNARGNVLLRLTYEDAISRALHPFHPDAADQLGKRVREELSSLPAPPDPGVAAQTR